MTETAFVVGVAVELRVIFKAIGEIFLGFLHEDFLLCIAGALSLWVAKRNLLADKVAIDFQKPPH